MCHVTNHNHANRNQCIATMPRALNMHASRNQRNSAQFVGAESTKALSVPTSKRAPVVSWRNVLERLQVAEDHVLCVQMSRTVLAGTL